MFCTNCGKEVADGAVVCTSCGLRPQGNNKFCAKCGKPIQPGQVVCLSCGSAVGGGTSPPPVQGINPQQTFCTNCGKPVSINAVACMSCGSVPKGHKNFCGNCGNSVNAQQIVCTKCGSSLTGVRPSTPSYNSGTSGNRGSSDTKSRMVAALLAILLGGVGAHKFYLGSWGWGLVYLVTSLCGILLLLCMIPICLVPGIVGLIEGILYFTMSDDTFAEKYSPDTKNPWRW